MGWALTDLIARNTVGKDRGCNPGLEGKGQAGRVSKRVKVAWGSYFFLLTPYKHKYQRN